MGSTRTRSGLALAMTFLGLVLLIEVGLAGRVFNAQHLAGIGLSVYGGLWLKDLLFAKAEGTS